MDKSVTLQQFNKFYVEKLKPRSCFWGSDPTTHEFKYIDIGVDSRTSLIWRITLDMKHPTKELVVDSTMAFEGNILEHLEHKLNERLAAKQSGAI